MNHELVNILVSVREKVTDNSDMTWTSFETAQELIKRIGELIERLQRGDKSVLEDIYLEFAPTSTFQEHSMQNDWSDEYMRLADQFDKNYKNL